MNITRALFAPGHSAFFFDDQRAIKAGAVQDGFGYAGEPLTPGFERIREAGESISVLLRLENGHIARGDCAAVQYSGAGGRDPLFRASEYIPVLERHVRPWLEGRPLDSFRTAAAELEQLQVNGARLHTSLRYGLSQALLDAHAKATGRMMCQVVADEYGLTLTSAPVPIFGQTGDSRYENADKMILKRVDVLPHGLINNPREKLGPDGGKLREYIRWLAARVKQLRTDESYRPTLHIDVYGTPGLAFEYNRERIADYLASLEQDADGLPLYIEGPVDVEEKQGQIELLAGLRQDLVRRGSAVKIVADEWCNTLEDIRDFCDARACDMVQIKTPDLGCVHNVVEAVLYCRQSGIEAYQGGTCNETDISARCCVHIAFAARAARMLAKPGMGFDEGFSIVYNEQQRILALLRLAEESEACP
ncbi:MAG: methylaspartate ammonia-lyase [Chitinivibrionales bacterium]|nr:methylaspartate ammonia-lyase [Chitinivibrionales bacterium]